MVWQLKINSIKQEENVVILNASFFDESNTQTESIKFGEHMTIKDIVTKLKSRLENIEKATILKDSLSNPNLLGKTFTKKQLQAVIDNN